MTDPNSINGLGDLLAFLDEMAEAGWEWPITAVLRLDVDHRLDLYQTFDAALAALDLPISPIEIPARTAVGKAAARGDPIARWRPDSPAGIAYQRLAAQLDAVPSVAGKGDRRRWPRSTSSSTNPSCGTRPTEATSPRAVPIAPVRRHGSGTALGRAQHPFADRAA
jgi:hypothetical protein